MLRQLLKKVFYWPPVQRTVLSLAAPVVPPPFRDPCMEVKYTIWGGISSLRCEDGHQVGENNVIPAYRKLSLAPRMQPVVDERTGRTLYRNITALESMMGHWDDSIRFIQMARAIFRRHLGERTGRLDSAEIYLLSKFCVCIPAYLARHVNRLLLDGAVGMTLATQVQLITGMFMTVRKMIEGGYLRISEVEAMTPEAFFDYADEQGAFITAAGNVCAGSKRKIIEFMASVIDEPTAPYANTDDLWEALGLAGHGEAFLHYYRRAVTLELYVMLARSALAEPFYLAALNSGDMADRVDSLIHAHHDYCTRDAQSLGRFGVEQQSILDLLGWFEEQAVGTKLLDYCSRQSVAKTEESLLANYREALEFVTGELTQLQNSVNASLGLRDRVTFTVKEIHLILGVFPACNKLV